MKLKIKAWDKTSKSMIQDYGHVGQYGEFYPAEFHSSAYGKTCPDLILLLYTGLKDIKGNEIYEGDMLQYRDTPPKEIKWDVDRAGFECIDSESGTIMVSNVWGECEIVGNIYEGWKK